jgi:hypothetical protein
MAWHGDTTGFERPFGLHSWSSRRIPRLPDRKGRGERLIPQPSNDIPRGEWKTKGSCVSVPRGECSIPLGERPVRGLFDPVPPGERPEIDGECFLQRSRISFPRAFDPLPAPPMPFPRGNVSRWMGNASSRGRWTSFPGAFGRSLGGMPCAGRQWEPRNGEYAVPRQIDGVLASETPRRGHP